MDDVELFRFVVWAKDRYPNFTMDPTVYRKALREYLKSTKTAG